ncbi:23S rRNA (adenine(1618)-N(6))-methyltransferase RlmF [Parathalassolituus penaei]|uniref:Ribosomal RNA large subunit methyltransferase F n=1 Tax=Parathalassolituus penaei TaxID=2997323 RepID=A0A9X3EFN5_9GAMM|nr:23S rRNA (adenine(1618)-N(6))-methyltransferase RlmF [Parathalassolituus penaei]MCY0966644.1 23S rRNA (adenine(1618)-N(6))-methyltransferase RlmF [Parathalassolituus penaei]
MTKPALPKAATKPAVKPSGPHPRNRHGNGYDFAVLTQACPELQLFVQLNPAGISTIDFSNPQAVKTLNRALLQEAYGIQHWDIPEGYLCPPVPGRADYIHNLADLLASANQGKVPPAKRVKALDIGCGANCIYPLIGQGEYGWQFVGSDIDPQSLASAQRMLNANPTMASQIRLVQQNHADRCFAGVIGPADYFDLTLCNPPFHESAEQMLEGSERKWRNLGKTGEQKPGLNFGGQHNELWCDGGELAFVSRMIEESQQFGSQVFWFTSLVSKQANLPAFEKLLQHVGALESRVIQMAQGQKISRLIAWTFLNPQQQTLWRQMRWQSR